MNPRQQEYFRRQLLHWRSGLQANYKTSMHRIRTNDQHTGDLIDQSVRDRNKIMDVITRGRLEQTIRQIDAALRRIDNGTYGYCPVTGEEIGLERLMAYPIATLSVEAQEQVEKRQQTAVAASCFWPPA